MLTLTPNQPNQINVVPKKMTVTLWAFLWNTSGASFCPRRMRRPAQTTQRRCEQAPPPAKSRDGSVYSQRLGFHVQQAIGQYTIVVQQKLKIRDGTIPSRSNESPTTIIVAHAANRSW